MFKRHWVVVVKKNFFNKYPKNVFFKKQRSKE